MKKIVLLFILLVNILQAASLSVEINNNSLAGQAILTLYKGKDGFLKEDKAFQVVKFDLSPDKTIVSLNDLPAGEYAFTLYHDENNNSKLDKNFIKLPKEATGFSNNFRPKFKPNYEDFKFLVSGHTVQKVNLN